MKNTYSTLAGRRFFTQWSILIINIMYVSFGLTLLADETSGTLGGYRDQNITIDSIAHPDWPNHFVYLFHSSSPKKRFPIVFFCHGIGAHKPSLYDGLITEIVKGECAVMFSPFKSSLIKPKTCYAMMWNGFARGVKKWSAILDTNRIGFVGHSYGGGAVPGMAYKAITEYHWGSQSSFLYIMAPWFSHWITQKELESFPPKTRMVMQIFENDYINDPRMAFDIYRSINIPIEHKWFIYTHNDSINNGILLAGHDLPEGKSRSESSFDTLCYFGFRYIIRALTHHSKSIDHPTGNTPFNENFFDHIRQGECFNAHDSIDHLTQSALQFIKPEICYINFWHHTMNPRAQVMQSKQVGSPKIPIGSRVTFSNYLWYLFFPAMIRAQEEDLEDPFDQWEEDIEYRDTSIYRKMVQARRKKFKRAPGPIESGCGARGPYGVIQRFIPNSGRGKGKLYILLPQGGTGPFPVICFTPTLMTSAKKYRELLFQLASQGYIVLASTNKNHSFIHKNQQGTSLAAEFEMCLFMVSGMVDTTRIGFVAHSKGTDPILSVARTYIGQRKWGTQGIFIFLMAPRFHRGGQNIDVNFLPHHALVGIQVFEEHTTKEWHIAHHLFNNFTLADSQKFLMLVHSFGRGYSEVEADRASPRCEERDGELNCVDDYGIFRPVCAMAHQAFKPKENNNCSGETLSEIVTSKVSIKGWNWTPITNLSHKK